MGRRAVGGGSMEAVFAGGGEMGAMMRGFDWAQTAVGPVENWPQSLRTAVSILLDSGYPMYIAWGPEFVQFYNDAYRPILGSTKHPGALGQPSPECFPEVWDTIGPMFRQVLTAAQATTFRDFLLPLDRHGFAEECYFDFSYSAARDESGGVGGVFVTCSETTGRVLGQRRLATLRELGSALADTRSAEDVCARAAAVLEQNNSDLPFSLIYLVDRGGGRAVLAGASGIAAGEPAAPLVVEAGEAGKGEAAWPLGEVSAAGKAVVVSDLKKRFGRLPGGRWPEATSAAMALPMTIPGKGEDDVIGFLVTGLSPRLRIDDEYRGFLELVAGQIATGVSNLRAYQEALERAEALAELDRAKTDFFSNVSHEFRTPITLSLGPLADVLADNPEGGSSLMERDRERIEIAHRNSLRLLKLVNSLLDFSRIQAGTARAIFQPVDLGAVTRELASVFRSAITSAGLELVVDCPTLPEPVFIDPELWEKLVLNLLSNAFKFTFSGTITVAVAGHRGHASLSVTDTGVGIAEDQLDHIFERFHRVRGAQSRSFEGTGIGLSLVRQVVDLHGGRLDVESRPGEGTTFRVELPYGAAHLPDELVRTAPAAENLGLATSSFVEEARRWFQEGEQEDEITELLPLTESDAGAYTSAANDTHRVLVVDDNADMRDYLANLLGRFWPVETAADGVEALRKLRSRPVQMVITDVMMPRMDGFELIQALRSDPATAALPVIVLSARAGEEATVEGLEAGADEYLVKPFAARELLARVRSSFQMAELRSSAAESAARYQAAEAGQLRALEVLLAIGRHVDSTSDLETFFGELTATVADLVQAKRAAFWLLDPEREVLSVQRASHGFPDDVVAALTDLPARPDGKEFVDQIVYQDLVLDPSNLNEARFDIYRKWLDLMGVRDAIAAGWRAGERPLGLVAAYDSYRKDGFQPEDAWVLRAAGLAAGLVWQHREAERRLDDLRGREATQLRAQVSRMTELEEIKAEFLRLASHELRGPLAVLKGYLDMIVSGTLGPSPRPLEAIYPILVAKVGEMGRLVEQMLETARLEDQKLALATTPFDLRSAVDEAVETLRPLLGDHHRIEVEVPAEKVVVVGDHVRIVTILTNLIENAIKYSTDGGLVQVKCALELAGQVAVAEVIDEGIGIEEKDLERIFTRFGRVVNDDNSHVSGTGLGLYLAREIARRHGGEISVTSSRGVGTRARLVLPAEPPPLGQDGR